MEMYEIVLDISLHLTPHKKKRLKITGHDIDTLLSSLRDQIVTKVLKPHCKNESIPDYSLHYKCNDDQSMDLTDLEDTGDLAILLDDLSKGKKVRIYVHTGGFADWNEKFLSDTESSRNVADYLERYTNATSVVSSSETDAASRDSDLVQGISPSNMPPSDSTLPSDFMTDFRDNIVILDSANSAHDGIDRSQESNTAIGNGDAIVIDDIDLKVGSASKNNKPDEEYSKKKAVVTEGFDMKSEGTRKDDEVNEGSGLKNEDDLGVSQAPSKEERSIMVQQHLENGSDQSHTASTEAQRPPLYSEVLNIESQSEKKFPGKIRQNRELVGPISNCSTCTQVRITFIASTKVGGFLTLCYAVGQSLETWIREEFSEVDRFEDGRIIQTSSITLQIQNTQTKLYYKLYNYKIRDGRVSDGRFEMLSENFGDTENDDRGNRNRWLRLNQEEMTVCLVPKFDRFCSEIQRFNHFMDLLLFIAEQCSSFADMLIYMKSFERDSLAKEFGKLFGQHHMNLFESIFKNQTEMNSFMLLCILPDFRLPKKSVKDCSIVLLEFFRKLSPERTKEIIWSMERINKLIKIHGGNVPLLILSLHALSLKLDGCDMKHSQHLSILSKIPLDVHFFKKCNGHLYEALLDRCLPYADINALAFLINARYNLSYSKIIKCIESWDLSSLRKMEPQDTKKTLDIIFQHLLDQTDRADMTDDLKKLFESIKREVPNHADKNSAIIFLYGHIYNVYLLCAVTWNKAVDHDDYDICVMEKLDVYWWTALYRRMENIIVKMNENEVIESRKSMEMEILLSKFERYLLRKEDKAKQVMVEATDFLDESVYPKRMVNLVIENFQNYIIGYLSNNRNVIINLFVRNKAFKNALAEILIRRFPNGIVHRHLMKSNPSDQLFFPWEEVLEIQDFHSNPVVSDARELLEKTYSDLRDGKIKLGLLRTLIDDNNRFYPRLCILIAKVSKNLHMDEIEDTGRRAVHNLKQFHMILENCNLLIESFEKTTDCKEELPHLQLKDYNNFIIEDIWTCGLDVEQPIMLKKMGHFSGITDEQLRIIPFARSLCFSNLYSSILRRNMCNLDTLAFDNSVVNLVAGALDPTISKLINILKDIKTEVITQEKMRTLFCFEDGSYESFHQVREELTTICDLLHDDLGEGIRENTFKKIRINLSDFHLAFRCLDAIKRTLKITSSWGSVETLRQMVCNAERAAPLSAIDSTLDVEFFFKIRDSHALISGFEQSEELISWIRDIASEVNDITTFIDLANTLEDAATSDRLSGLHKFIIGIWPLIFEIDEFATFDEFQTAFNKMIEYVEDDSQITKTLKDATENLKWFKEMHEMQTDTTKSSISQFELMRSCGVFIIGSIQSRAESSDFFKEWSMNALMSAEITSPTGEVRQWKYKDLKELNDKLVLISGEHDKVYTFTQVFGKLTQICETFKELNECGHRDYLIWEERYHFVDPESTVRIVDRHFRQLQEELVEERRRIESCIKQFKPLMNYTYLQLLYLRYQLRKIMSTPAPDSSYQQTLILLRTINPQITLDIVAEEVRRRCSFEEIILSIEELGEVLNKIHVMVEGDTSALTNILRQGNVTLLKVNSREVIRCVLSLYKLIGRSPTPEEVLCCTNKTTEQELSVFLRRTIFGNDFRLVNCLVGPEKLTYQLNRHFIEYYEFLLRDNMNTQPQFFLVIITAENAPSEIASTFVQGQRQFVPAHTQHIIEFTAKYILYNDECICDAERLSGRIIQSESSGNGKSRKAATIHSEFDEHYQFHSIPIHNLDCDRNIIVREFLEKNIDCHKNVIYLVEISPSVFEGADIFIFELVVLRKLSDSSGRVFRPARNDYLLVEGLFTNANFMGRFAVDVTTFLPYYNCLSPRQTLDILKTGQHPGPNQIALDRKQFVKENWQRVFQYLHYYQHHHQSIEEFKFDIASVLTEPGHERQCIETFLQYIVHIPDPSWRELDNFVRFLDTQLRYFELSDFTKEIVAQELGSEFNNFVVKFLIKMSEEFATRSINISEGSDVLENHRLQKLWDKTFHPYLFFEEEGHCISFIGFRIQPPGNLMDVVTNEIKQENFMSQELLGRLYRQEIKFDHSLKDYTTELLLEKLCTILNLRRDMINPAADYQLTLDNSIKIVAIHMRMRSNIPVVIMGETGCGKTRLIAFMADIIKQSILNSHFTDEDRPLDIENLITLRVHGGITSEMIRECIREAEAHACRNRQISDRLETIVFFDEANATSEIDLIREIMCNHTIEGIRINSSLRFIAAVNPYRKHTPAMISQLKKAGLGYQTHDNAVFDRIGDIPLREVVYRVHPLPPSLKPLIWDFGSMDNCTEKKYIQLIVKCKLADMSIQEEYLNGLVDIISGCQDTLRRRTDQCSFVSLRDVNRFIEVFKWFLTMIPILCEVAAEQGQVAEECSTVVQAAVNAIGVCYYVRIADRREYINTVASFFRHPFPSFTGHELSNMIVRTQQVLLHELLHNGGVDFADVAENEALRENIFMMVVCIELNIPLFIVGHPGSSKSLAKLIVKACMSGLSSRSNLLAHLCQITMISLQCSPQSEAEGIEKTFAAAEKFISESTDKKHRRVMPVVVLDEIGLAEDSKKMPLKALHSLLENNGLSDHTKIGFIGISNWALDPAKMNRGLYVTRQEPDLDELQFTALQICKANMRDKLKGRLYKVAEVYSEIYREYNTTDSRSYIGLRDFYCLVKHMCRRAEDKEADLSDGDVLNSVYRNFGGICREASENVIRAFRRHFNVRPQFIPTTVDMINDNLRATTLASGSRYLLIVTPTLETTIDVVDQYLRKINNGRSPQIKFNSDFPDDADYTKRCKIINDVKNSIEVGDDLLLIDMEMIYESLYDVLNQYYKEWQGKKYVEIALESHRVNCRVHDRAKIILLARPEQAVKFPIPLLNRLEKHYFTLGDNMSETENVIVRSVQKWVDDLTTFTDVYNERSDFCYNKNEIFIGMHVETIPSIVKTQLKRYQQSRGQNRPLYKSAHLIPHLEEWCQEQLLKTVSHSGLVMMSLSNEEEFNKVMDKYYDENGKIWPVVKDMKAFLKQLGKASKASSTVITTFSHLPAKKNFPKCKTKMLIFNIQDFGSQTRFENAVEDFYKSEHAYELLVILVPPTRHHFLSYMRFYLQSQRHEDNNTNKHVIILVQLIRNSDEQPALFQSEVWDHVHIEDLNLYSESQCRIVEHMSRLNKIWFRNIPKLFDDEILSIMGMLVSHKEEVACHISNPFPHVNFGAVLQECVTSGVIQQQISNALVKVNNDMQMEKTEEGRRLTWIQEAAMDKAKLSEQTSFQNMLLSKITERLTWATAYVFVGIDRDGNAALRIEGRLRGLWDALSREMLKTFRVPPHTATFVKVEHNFVSRDTHFNPPLQFPFSWLLKKPIDDVAGAVYRLTTKNEDELREHFMGEFDGTGLYEALSSGEIDDVLRRELNGRYMVDFVNMVHVSKSETEMQVAVRILECMLPSGAVDKHIVEFAVDLYITYQHRSRGYTGHFLLSSLTKLFTVFSQEMGSDLSSFSAVSSSERPVFTLCDELLSILGSSPEKSSTSNAFTLPLTLLIPACCDEDSISHLMTKWEKVRFKSLTKSFLGRLDVSREVQDNFYAIIEQTLEQGTVHDCFGVIVGRVWNELILATVVHIVPAEFKNTLNGLWICAECHSVTYKQFVTDCFHVFCPQCYEALSNSSAGCSVCQADILQTNSPIPEPIKGVVKVVEDYVNETVDFLSHCLVSFFTEEKLGGATLAIISQLGRGRVEANQLLKPASPQKLESFQSLIFAILANQTNPMTHIMNVCCPKSNQELDPVVIAKFCSLFQAKHPMVEGPSPQDIAQLLDEYLQLNQPDMDMDRYLYSSMYTVTYLRQAFARLAHEFVDVLDTGRASELLTSLQHGFEPFAPRQIYTVKLFLLKQIFKQRGLRVIHEVMRTFSWASPVALVNSHDPDHFLLLGQEYANLRNALATSNAHVQAAHAVNEQVIEAVESCNFLQIVAATLHVVTSGTPLPANAVGAVQYQVRAIGGNEALLAECIQGTLFRNTPVTNNARVPGALKSPLKLLHLVLLSSPTHPFLRILDRMRSNPAQATALFLPGMRENSLMEFVGNLGERGRKYSWYTCEKGHAYAINQCGLPMEQGRCLCGAPIGGQNHTFTRQGVTALTNADSMDFNEKGYNLLPPGARPHTDTERSLSPLTLDLTRWFVHASFFLSELTPAFVQTLFNTTSDAHTFLIDNLIRDMNGVGQHLQLGPEETGIFISKTMIALSTTNLNADYTCHSKEERANVENAFLNAIRSLLENPGNAIREAQTCLVNDINVAADPFLKQIYELEDPSSEVCDPATHCHIELWKNSQRVSMDLFSGTFLNALPTEGQEAFPAITMFIEMRNDMEFVGLLPTILDFYKRLLARFSYKISLEEARNMPIGEVIRGEPELENGFEAWIKAWARLSSNSSRIPFPDEYREKDQIQDTEPLSLFLPELPDNFDREGICSLHIVDGLVSLHNKMARICQKPEAKLLDRFLTIEYDEERAFKFLLFSTCFLLKGGKHVETAFSYPIFERYLMDEVLGGVVPICDSLSQYESDDIKMTYREDVTWLDVCAKLNEREPQERMPRSVLLEFTDIRVATRMKRALATAIGFIRSGLGASLPHEPLIDFMARIGEEDTEIQLPPQLLKCHVLDTWYTVYFYQSLLSRHNPFSAVGATTTIPPQYRQWIDGQNRKIVECWLMEFHRFLIDWTVLKPGVGDLTDWVIVDCYDFYKERALLPRHPDALPSLPPLPEGLLYQESVAFWLELKACHLRLRMN